MYTKNENTTPEEEQEMADANENSGRKDFQEEGQHSDKWCKIGTNPKATAKQRKLACADCLRGLVYDVKPEFNAMSMKDRRISFLSIFSSLTQGEGINWKRDEDGFLSPKTLAKKAYELNEELYKHYPTEDN